VQRALKLKLRKKQKKAQRREIADALRRDRRRPQS
jgi:hypothetical protein